MLTTLAQVLAELKANNTATPDQKLIMRYIANVTARVRNLSWNFEPVYTTEYFTASPWDTNSLTGELSLKNKKGQRLLLASSTDTPSIISNGVTFTYGTQVVGDPQSYTPIRTLRIVQPWQLANGLQWYPYNNNCNWIDTIAITGWWGYRRDYATEGFLNSEDSVQDAGGISPTVTSITVNNVDAMDPFFQTPLFSAGNLIRIDNELILVMATDTTTNILSVRRGQNGTTAASHNEDTPIYIWYPEPSLVQEVTRQAALLYSRRGAFEKVTVNQVATIMYPPDLEGQLLGALQEYNND